MTEYEKLCKTKSDINEHLPTLKKYAEKCKHITEFGVRSVVSTYAFIEGNPKTIRAYDLNIHKNMYEALALAKTKGIDLKFIIDNTLETEIGETDFLFIDTLHTFEQLTAELLLHHGKVKKFIGFHDTHTFGNVDERPHLQRNNYPPIKDGEGLKPAIINFIAENPEWKIDYETEVNNGLIILKKVK
jgi:hypothetical protein